MFILIPLSRILIESPIVLKNITLSSKLAFNENCNILINSVSYHITLFNKSNVLELFDEGFAVYHLDELDISGDLKILVERLIEPVDLALDSLRESLNSFGFHEQVIGTPGFYMGNEQVVALSDDFESYQIIKGKKLYYGLSEGIGCDATGFCIDDNEILLSSREDEVYVKYRSVLHHLFKAMQAYDVNTCFAFLFSTIEGMDCINSDRFQTKKIRILSFIGKNQQDFDRLSQQFYFYSKTIRTDVIHAGKSLYDILPWKKIYDLLDDLYLLVIKFCMASIECGATTFSDLNVKINEKCNQFVYTSPRRDASISELLNTSYRKCDYFAEVTNLNISSCLKIGKTLFLPAHSKNNIKEFREVYEHGLKICLAYDLDEKTLKIDGDFPNYYLFSKFNVGEKSFTVWDVDVLLTTLLRNVAIDGPFAIMENQSYWENPTTGFNFPFYCEFSDIICNEIQKPLNYLILSNELTKDTILPSKVGVNSSGIRAAYISENGSSGIYCILGRVYGEYIEPPVLYNPSLAGCSEILYNCFFDSRSDEVFSTNHRALNRIADSLYFQDANQTILAIFDALDMLYPTTYNGDKLIKRIATFCCDTLEEKNELVEILNNLRTTVRNPIIHGGKLIYDLISNEDEIYCIINKIITVIIKYCENVYKLNILTFDDLHKEEKSKNLHFSTH